MLEGKTRTLRLQVLMVALAVAVAAAVGSLVWRVQQSGGAIMTASHALIREHAPRLAAIARLRADVLQIERSLYEYYATSDPDIYQRTVRPLVASASAAAGPAGAEILALVSQFALEGEALDWVMRATPIDWDQARAVLEQVSTVGRAIFSRLDAEVTRVESAVVQAGEHTEASVVASTSLSWIVSAVIALAGMGILFALRAYLHENAERREAQRRIAYAALHDELTGLPNRRRLLSRLGEVTRRGDPIGLLLLRLARYHTVVAGLGHRAADQLLAAAAARLAERVAAAELPQATLHRLEGETFAIAAPVGDRLALARFADALVREFAVPVAEGEQSVVLDLVTGYARTPDDAPTGDDLLQAAELALQAAQSSPAAIAGYSEELGRDRRAALALEQALRQALGTGQFEFFFQPQLDGAGKLVGAETLIRWRHPDRGLVSPADFIPVAETSGLIVPIGREVLTAACSQGRAWLEAGRPPLLIAVNVSARQCVQSGFVDEVAAVLGETGYPPHWLELEITESVAAQDAEATVALLAALKALGVRLAIDDFGTGFSSLSYLRRFPIDKLKVDQSFVRGLPDDGQSAAIARTVIALGRELSLTVIAEGVETEAQETWLVAHGCHELQGFRYSRPLPAGEFDRWRAALAGLSYAPAA